MLQVLWGMTVCTLFGAGLLGQFGSIGLALTWGTLGVALFGLMMRG